MSNIIRFPIKHSFAAGQAAHGRGLSLAVNPFIPGTYDYTQWVIGHQWGPSRSEAPTDSIARQALICRFQPVDAEEAVGIAPDRARNESGG